MTSNSSLNLETFLSMKPNSSFCEGDANSKEHYQLQDPGHRVHRFGHCDGSHYSADDSVQGTG